MIWENRQLVTDEPVEVVVYRKITYPFRGIYRIYPNLTKETEGCQHRVRYTRYFEFAEGSTTPPSRLSEFCTRSTNNPTLATLFHHHHHPVQLKNPTVADHDFTSCPHCHYRSVSILQDDDPTIS